jgi:integrase
MDFTLYGKRVLKSTGKYTAWAARLEEAKERERIEQEIKNPSLIQVRRVLTLDEAIEKCYKERWVDNADGLGSYNKAKKIAEIIGGDKTLDQINHEDLIAIRTYLEAKGNKPATVNRYLATLRVIMRMALREWKMIKEIPVFKLRKERPGRIREVSREEERIILKYYSDYGLKEMKDLIICLVDTGARLSELLMLEYQDVDFDLKLIRIWKNKADIPRSVPMTNRVYVILKQRQKFHKPFSLSIDQVEGYWAKVRRHMHLEKDPDFVPHILRHTCACRLVRAGVDLYTVKNWLGHSSIKTTERYAHLFPRDLLNVVDRLEA